jgi:hypothetical protein
MQYFLDTYELDQDGAFLLFRCKFPSGHEAKFGVRLSPEQVGNKTARQIYDAAWNRAFAYFSRIAEAKALEGPITITTT